MATCICREEPESPVGNLVLLIKPNVLVPTVTPGWPRFGWFRTSKASARISNLIFSRILVCLISAISTLAKSGPMMTLRPRFP